ncbi:hypothetical protein KQI84_07710 [bacterium]|nr:hypothetical protein [bacterium]
MLHRTSIRTAFFLAALAIPTFAGAAQLSLDDVLTTTSTTTAPESGPLSGEAAARMIAEAEEDLAAGRIERAAEAATRLPERIPPNDPFYSDALWLSVRVSEATGDSATAMNSAREYLKFAPTGANAAAAQLAIARGEAMAGNWSASADQYLALINSFGNPAEHLESDAFLGAAEACVQARRPADARTALKYAMASPNLSVGARASAAYWMLESLLLEDDPSVPVPAGVSEGMPLQHAIALRRALLFEMRGESYQARPLYAELAWERDSLSPGERQILDARTSALELAQ